MKDIDANIAGLLQIAKSISFFIVLTATLCLTVLVLRLLKKDELKVGQIQLPISYFPALVLALTALHVFLTWIFAQKIHDLIALGADARNRAWEKLVNSEAWVFFNMKPRILESTYSGKLSVYVASTTDTAFWTTLGFVVVLIAAITASAIPIGQAASPDALRRLFSGFAGGCFLAGLNWVIGSHWAILASSLFG